MPRRIRAVLSQGQAAVLDLFAKTPLAARCTLSGGTALSAVYLDHRYSDDLDFFSAEEFGALALSGFIKTLTQAGLQVTRETRTNRQILHLRGRPAGRLRVEFVYFPFDPIERGTSWRGVTVDSFIDITVNKVHAVATRFEPKDLVDLYAIQKARGDLTLRRLLTLVRAKFDVVVDPLALAEKLLRVDEVQVLPRMVRPLARSTLRRFCIEEARRLARRH